MTASIVLCADTESVRHPETMGLEGESLGSQPWLAVFTSADAMRRHLRGTDAVDEAWVVSSDDIDPINAAAALKRDAGGRRVLLVAFDASGSLKSRASRAGIDGTLGRHEFLARYALEKRRRGAAGTGQAPLPAQAQPARDCPERPASGAGAGQPAAAGLPGSLSEADFSTAAGGSAAQGTGRLPVVGDGTCSAASGAPAFRGVVAPAVPKGFLLPVVSGSGGAGKSTVAALSALFAQGLGYRTLLVDLDLQFGDAAVMLGMGQAVGVDDVAATPARLAQLRPEGLVPAVLAAPRRLEQSEAVVAELPHLLDLMQESFDVVVANTGGFWMEQHALLLERCSKALFLVDQRPSSLRACRHALELCTRCGIAASPFVFAANRCAKGAPFTSIDVSCALHGAASVELRDGGPEVEELLGAGQPLDLIASKNDLCISLEHALVDLLPGCKEAGAEAAAAPVPRVARGLFGRRRGKRGAACLC